MGIRIHAVASAAAILLLAAPALAEVLKVPSEAYPTIQSAVDASGDGDVIVVANAPTSYKENLVIDGKSNLTIRGAGRGTVIGGANFSEDPTFRISGGTNITLRGFIVSTGGLAAQVTCEASGVAGLRIVDVEFKGGGDTGLSTTACTDVLVSRCRFISLDGDMILDDGSSGYVVERCSFLLVWGAAVSLSPGVAPGEGTDGAVLVKNVVDGVGVASPSSGFQVTGDGAVIDRNVLTGLTGDHGIAVTGSGSVVSRNRLAAGGTAISVAGGEAAVDRNFVYYAGDQGIRVDATPATVTGNRVRKAGLYGVGILVLSSGVTVSKNRATDSNVLDLADTQAEGVNTYEKNRFGTTQFSFVP